MHRDGEKQLQQDPAAGPIGMEINTLNEKQLLRNRLGNRWGWKLLHWDPAAGPMGMETIADGEKDEMELHCYTPDSDNC